MPETERLRSNFRRGGAFARQLPSFGLPVGQISGDFHQKQRLSGLRRGQKPRLKPFSTLKAPFRAKPPPREIFDQVVATESKVAANEKGSDQARRAVTNENGGSQARRVVAKQQRCHHSKRAVANGRDGHHSKRRRPSETFALSDIRPSWWRPGKGRQTNKRVRIIPDPRCI